MFEKFGEMGSSEELNLLADNLLNEGDIESLREMAEENGIDKEIVQLFVDGEVPYITDEMSAAIGKIEIECKELDPKEIMNDWVEYIKGQCAEDEKIAKAVRMTGKSLKGCISEILVWSFGNQISVDKEILAAAGIKAGRVTLGIPGMRQAKKIIRSYYLGK